MGEVGPYVSGIRKPYTTGLNKRYAQKSTRLLFRYSLLKWEKRREETENGIRVDNAEDWMSEASRVERVSWRDNYYRLIKGAGGGGL